MKDGCHNSITLTHSSTHNHVTLYHFQLTLNWKISHVSYRYSKLRSLKELLPQVHFYTRQVTTAFPPPKHLAKVFSQILGQKEFNTERFQTLRTYFKSISQH